MARRKWQKTGTAIRALGRMAAMQKMFKKKDNDSGDGNVSASLSSASGLGSGSSSSSSSTMGSQSTIIDANTNTATTTNNNSTNNSTTNTKPTSNSFKESTVELEKVVTPSHSKPANQDTDESSTTNQNGGQFKSTNHSLEMENAINRGDINSNTKTITSDRETPVSKVRVKTVENDNETCNDCTENSTRTLNQSASSKSGHPEFTKEMIDSKAFPGDAVRFDVAFKSDASISVTWYFEDDPVTEDERHNIQESDTGGSLIIKDVCEDDDGEYSCRINNVNGEETCTAELIVYGAL